MCLSAGVASCSHLLLVSMAHNEGWPSICLSKSQSGPALSMRFSIAWSSNRSHNWLLLSATIGLVIPNTKWQNQADRLRHELRLKQVNVLPPLLLQLRDDKVVPVVAKIDHDLFAAVFAYVVKLFIKKGDKHATSGAISPGTDYFCFFGMNMVQDSSSCSVDADDNINALWKHST